MTHTTTTEAISAVPTSLIEATNLSIIKTFDKMFGETSVEPAADAMHEGEGIVGLISFVGDITWSLAMMFPQSSVVGLAYKFSGFEIEYESADMGDVVGEIANVLAGVLCGELESRGVNTQMSLPTVTRGRQVELLLGGHLLAKRLNVSTAAGHFGVRLIVSKNNMTTPVLF